MSDEQSSLLAVDDEPLNLMVIGEVLEDSGYRVRAVADGSEAWGILSQDPAAFDVVLLDRMMAHTDGIEILRRMKQHPQLRLVPVILQTAATWPEQVAEGLEAGAFYYLSKPYDAAVLRAVVATAMRDRRDRKLAQQAREAQKAVLPLLAQAEFQFRTISQARDLASHISQLCPDPEAACMGLLELMLNAVEHGNLALTYDEKTTLINEDRLQEEISRRLTLPEYAHRRASLRLQRVDHGFIFTISDEGSGFDWRSYMDMDANRLMDNHGRGIAVSRKLAFSNLEYRGAGNIAVATITDSQYRWVV